MTPASRSRVMYAVLSSGGFHLGKVIVVIFVSSCCWPASSARGLPSRADAPEGVSASAVACPCCCRVALAARRAKRRVVATLARCEGGYLQEVVKDKDVVSAPLAGPHKAAWPVQSLGPTVRPNPAVLFRFYVSDHLHLLHLLLLWPLLLRLYYESTPRLLRLSSPLWTFIFRRDPLSTAVLTRRREIVYDHAMTTGISFGEYATSRPNIWRPNFQVRSCANAEPCIIPPC